VVSQPAPVGYFLRHGQILAAFRRREPRRHCSVLPDERTIAGSRQKPGVHQGSEHRVADVALQTPEPLGLGCGQAETRHLNEFSLHSLEHFVNPHVSASSVSQPHEISVCDQK
jgi:hypothetical protein